MFRFTLERKSSQYKARTGTIEANHGVVETPVLMPAGTRATVKAVSNDELKSIGSQIALSNTYHLYLKPGQEIIREADGLHKFMNWNRPILTDNGGFQVFSLSRTRKITEKGVQFRSHIDGSKHFISSEKSMEIQNDLGSDMMMAFGEYVPYPAGYEYTEDFVKRALRWFKRYKDYHRNTDRQNLFGIIQGGMYKDLREYSAKNTIGFDLPRYAVGGLSVGEPRDLMIELLNFTTDFIPESKSRYLMGVGTPDYLFETVEHGVDTCGCVFSTRIARNGTALTSRGRLVVKSAKHEDDFTPLDENRDCCAYRNHTGAYIRHLLNVDKILGAKLLSIYNLRFLIEMMENIRKSIEEDRCLESKDELYRNCGYDYHQKCGNIK